MSEDEETQRYDGEEPDWEPLSIYLDEDTREQFNSVFLERLLIENADLRENDVLKRDLQEAAVQLLMESPDAIVERTRENLGIEDD